MRVGLSVSVSVTVRVWVRAIFLPMLTKCRHARAASASRHRAS